MAQSRQKQTLEDARQALSTGRHDTAAAIALELTRKSPGAIEAWRILGAACYQGNDYPKAVAAYETVTGMKRSTVKDQINLAVALTQVGRLQESRDLLQPVLAETNDQPNTVACLASTYIMLGDFQGATETLEASAPSIQTSPTLLQIKATLLEAEKRYEDAEKVITVLLGKQGLTSRDQSNAHLLAARLYDKLGDFDMAFEQARTGNMALKGNFNAHDYVRSIKEISCFFTPERMSTLPRNTAEHQRLIFIVGCQRSGSTLTEQMLGAHAGVQALGETMVIPGIVNEWCLRTEQDIPYPKSLPVIGGKKLQELATAALTELQQDAGDQKILVDKMLDNYQTLGLINILLPASRVIHMTRDARDTALSCYMNSLPATWTRSMEDIALVMQGILFLMHHWQQTLDLPILQVQYELLVKDLKSTGGQILEFAGLDWDEQCLLPHTSGKAVMTQSTMQIREPVYKTAIERWKQYQKHLGPLEDAMNKARCELPIGT